MKNLKGLYVLGLALVLMFAACSDDDDPVTPAGPKEATLIDNGNGTGTRTLYSDTIYFLEGMVFVNAGQELTIQAGTVIKGKPGTGENASALIVARGGKINAVGTAQAPIIFTCASDDLNGSVNINDRALWGGVIVLGKARLNSTPGETAIEGIPTSEVRGLYGGTDDADNSGTLKYISIRHGGSDIGEGNEINGLTLGGVGSGTTFDYIEVIANKDDGVEFFGGCPNVKHVIVSYCGDDSFDYDEGYRGKGQFWCAIQEDTEGDRCGEHDGGTDPELGTPYAIPQIFNATYIGRGAGDGKRIITFRDNAGGVYANSIFVNQDKGIDIELLAGEGTYDRFQAGELELNNNIFFNVADGTAAKIFTISFGEGATANADSISSEATFADYFATAHNEVFDCGVTAENPIPTNATGNNPLAAYPVDVIFETVNYKGAFGATNWAEGWTLIFGE